MEQGEDEFECAWPVEVKLETEDEEISGAEAAVPLPTSNKRGEVRTPKICQCPHCDYCTPRTDHFKRHVLRHPEQKLFSVGSEREPKSSRTCTECGYTTTRKDHFKRHLMRHTGEKPYSCKTCDYATTHSIHLKRHYLRMGHEPNVPQEIKKEPKKSSIEIMEAEWPLEVKLEEDVNEDSDEGLNPPSCPQPSTSFASTQIVNSEKKELSRQQHNDKRIEIFRRRRREKGPRHCTECGYTTLRSDHFKRHMMRHTGEKPFVCNLCNFATARAARLRNHIAMHSDTSRPYSCEKCPYRTTQMGRLRTHMKQHTI